MNKFRFLVKLLIEYLLIFLISYIWLNFYIKNHVYASIIALSIALIIEGIVQGFRHRKDAETMLKDKEKQDADKMFFSLLQDNSAKKFFIRLLSTKHSNVKPHGDMIILEKSGEKIVISTIFKYENLGSDDVIKAFQKVKNLSYSKLVILCGQCTKDATETAKSLSDKIYILDKYQTYLHFYKEYEFYPEITLTPKVKNSFKNFFKSFFASSHAKGYITASIFLLIGSYFTKMNVYYLISTSVLMFFGLICLFNKKEKPSNFSF